MATLGFKGLDTTTGMTRGNLIPTKILEKDVLSDTSEAYQCLVDQKPSLKLQAYLINYVISVSSPYSVYG